MSVDILRNNELAEENAKLKAAIAAIHKDWHATDLCWRDLDKLFAAARLPPLDYRVGDKTAMRWNCDRFIDHVCQDGGPWVSYAELEQRLAKSEAGAAAMRDALDSICLMGDAMDMPDIRWRAEEGFAAYDAAKAERKTS